MNLAKNPVVQKTIGALILQCIINLAIALILGYWLGWRAGLGVAILAYACASAFRFHSKSDFSSTKEGVYQTYLEVTKSMGVPDTLSVDEVYKKVCRRVYLSYLIEVLVSFGFLYWSAHK